MANNRCSETGANRQRAQGGVMAFVLVAHWKDIEESAFEMIAVFTNRDEAKKGKREMLVRRARIHSGDVAGYDWFYRGFARGEMEYNSKLIDNRDAHQNALKMWSKVQAIIGDVPYRLFDTDWEYEVAEVRDGLSFPNGMKLESNGHKAVE